MRISIISVLSAGISVPAVLGTLISANETLIKTEHEKPHNFMKEEISKYEGDQRIGRRVRSL